MSASPLNSVGWVERIRAFTPVFAGYARPNTSVHAAQLLGLASSASTRVYDALWTLDPTYKLARADEVIE
jgi:hypothetical protein